MSKKLPYASESSDGILSADDYKRLGESSGLKAEFYESLTAIENPSEKVLYVIGSLEDFTIVHNAYVYKINEEAEVGDFVKIGGGGAEGEVTYLCSNFTSVPATAAGAAITETKKAGNISSLGLAGKGMYNIVLNFQASATNEDPIAVNENYAFVLNDGSTEIISGVFTYDHSLVNTEISFNLSLSFKLSGALSMVVKKISSNNSDCSVTTSGNLFLHEITTSVVTEGGGGGGDPELEARVLKLEGLNPSLITIKVVTELPALRTPNTLYFIRDYTQDDYVEFEDSIVNDIIAENYGDGTGITIDGMSNILAITPNTLFANSNITAFLEFSMTNVHTSPKFNNCQLLKYIDYSNITAIPVNGVFSFCTDLEYIIMPDVPPVFSGTSTEAADKQASFLENTTNVKLRVSSEEVKEAYMNDPLWSLFGESAYEVME